MMSDLELGTVSSSYGRFMSKSCKPAPSYWILVEYYIYYFLDVVNKYLTRHI